MNYLPARIIFTATQIELTRGNFSAGQIFTIQEPIFILLIYAWSRANWEIITNNLTSVIEVALMDVALCEALL